MERIILFRFHKRPSICKNRIELLRLFNPDVKIYGLYGGDERDFHKYEKDIGELVENVYCIRGKETYWKWKNGDLAALLWYKDVGRYISFDMLHFIEWDMLLFDSLSNIYKHIPKDGVGLSGLTPLENVEKTWSWVSKEPFAGQWTELQNYAKKQFNYVQTSHACVAVGCCFPKEMLEKYSAIQDVPEFCNDEVRIALFSQVLGFTLYDTGLYDQFDKTKWRYFNMDLLDIDKFVIKNEIHKLSGVRVFHPYRKVFCNTLANCDAIQNKYYEIKDFINIKLGR